MPVSDYRLLTTTSGWVAGWSISECEVVERYDDDNHLIKFSSSSVRNLCFDSHRFIKLVSQEERRRGDKESLEQIYTGQKTPSADNSLNLAAKDAIEIFNLVHLFLFSC